MAAAPPLLQPSDRFALRWNDFPDNVTAIFRFGKLCVCASVTLVYRQLRRDGQLADVTLMCAGGRQVRAGGIYGWSKHNGGKSNIVCEESSRKLSPVQSAADINMRDQ